MENVTDALQKEIKRIWPKAKKNISKINKDMAKLLKKKRTQYPDRFPPS